MFTMYVSSMSIDKLKTLITKVYCKLVCNDALLFCFFWRVGGGGGGVFQGFSTETLAEQGCALEYYSKLIPPKADVIFSFMTAKIILTDK